MTKLPMSTPPGEPQTPTEPGPRPLPVGSIRDGVLAALGRPPSLYRVTVAPLWAGHYRVNVLVGTDLTLVEIAHSYFVTADETGCILTAAPPLARAYP